MLLGLDTRSPLTELARGWPGMPGRYRCVCGGLCLVDTDRKSAADAGGGLSSRRRKLWGKRGGPSSVRKAILLSPFSQSPAAPPGVGSPKSCHLLTGLKSTHFLQFRGFLKWFLPFGEAQRIRNWDLLSHSPALSTFALTAPCHLFPVSHCTHSLTHPPPCHFPRCRLIPELSRNPVIPVL